MIVFSNMWLVSFVPSSRVLTQHARGAGYEFLSGYDCAFLDSNEVK